MVNPQAIKAAHDAIRTFPEGQWRSKSSIMLNADRAVIPLTAFGSLLTLMAMEELVKQGKAFGRTVNGPSNYRVYCWRRHAKETGVDTG